MKQSWLPALRGVRCDNAETEKTENGAPARGGTDKKVRSRFYGCEKGRRKEKNKKVRRAQRRCGHQLIFSLRGWCIPISYSAARMHLLHRATFAGSSCWQQRHPSV